MKRQINVVMTILHYLLILDESKVIYATEGKGASTIASFKETFENQGGEISEIKNVSCDMSPAFISGIKKNIP